MSSVTLDGKPLSVTGSFPKRSSKAPSFTLTNQDLQEVSLNEYTGKRKVLNIVPSLDTPVCATSTRKFNEKASGLPNTAVLVISADLPFAMSRFCVAEGLKNVQVLSTFRNSQFLQDYGVNINEGALKGLTARAVIVLNENDQVIHSELVSEISNEPNYDAALAALK